jgi:hypothetical protein
MLCTAFMMVMLELHQKSCDFNIPIRSNSAGASATAHYGVKEMSTFMPPVRIACSRCNMQTEKEALDVVRTN